MPNSWQGNEFNIIQNEDGKNCNNHVTEINTDANHIVVYDSALDDLVE